MEEVIAENVIVPLIKKILQEIQDVFQLNENRCILEDQLNRVKDLLKGIMKIFGDQQRKVPNYLQTSLLKTQREVEKGKELIDRSKLPWLQWCIDYIRCKPRVSTQIREWKTTIEELIVELGKDFSLIHNAQQVAAAEGPQQEVLLQDLPDTGLIGMDIKVAEGNLQSWISDDPPVQIIGVRGMGGVGKTTLLKKVYNIYKERLGSQIQAIQIEQKNYGHTTKDGFTQGLDWTVIYVTVAQFPISQLQKAIASTIGLDLAECSSHDMRKMKLLNRTREMKFLLFLDDLWSMVDLNELGVKFGVQNGSKVVFSTRNNNIIGEMKAEKCIELQALSTEEGRLLFSKVAFNAERFPNNFDNIAREVADECKGLPLAIHVIASTLRGNTEAQWELALKQMRTVDLNFPHTHPRIEKDLYQRLRLSYDYLPEDTEYSKLKSCFLYSANFKEDEPISVMPLLQMWIAEGFMLGDKNILSETGRSYVDLIKSRGLFQYSSWGESAICLHDVIRDMAIYIAEKEKNCIFKAGLELENFPDIPNPEHCKRISVRGNFIKSLPAVELECPKLVSLNLALNDQLKEIPEAFFVKLLSLRVLDLYCLPIKKLPESLWQMTKLQYLHLGKTNITVISRKICNLSNLQFLHLTDCGYLKSLPRQIGELHHLKYLDIRGCKSLSEIPIRNLSECIIQK